MKTPIQKFAALTVFLYAAVATAATPLEYEIQQKNREYFNLLFYAITLDPTLATEQTVKNYINFIKPSEIQSAADEFELHEIYTTQEKAFTQKTAEHKFDTTNILKFSLGIYNFEKSSFPLIYIASNNTQDIYRPCLSYGLRQSCQKTYPQHGLPSTISIRFSDFPKEVAIPPEKTKTLISPPKGRDLISDIEYKRGTVDVHNEKYRPLEWVIVLSPKTYTIRSSSQEVLLEKKSQ